MQKISKTLRAFMYHANFSLILQYSFHLRRNLHNYLKKSQKCADGDSNSEKSEFLNMPVYSE